VQVGKTDGAAVQPCWQRLFMMVVTSASISFNAVELAGGEGDGEGEGDGDGDGEGVWGKGEGSKHKAK